MQACHNLLPAGALLGCCFLQDTVQTVQALKAASGQMRSAMKANKELDLNFIDNLQVCSTCNRTIHHPAYFIWLNPP